MPHSGSRFPFVCLLRHLTPLLAIRFDPPVPGSLATIVQFEG